MRALCGLIGLLLLLLLSAACSKGDSCKTVCVRVARCRLEARQGKALPGERAPAPDASCMKRCQEGGEAFAKCEGVHRTCDKLRGCLGPLR